MVKPLNTSIPVRVQVIDANSDPVTGATVQIKVIMPNGSDWDGTWSMTHLGDGIYAAEFEPDVEGVWVAQCFSANPKFRKSFTYTVGYDGWVQQSYVWSVQSNPTQDVWITIIDESCGTIPQAINFAQDNEDSTQKFCRIEVTMDNVVMEGYYNLYPHEHTVEPGAILALYYANTGGPNNTPGIATHPNDQSRGAWGQSMGDSSQSEADFAVQPEAGCKHFMIRVKLVSAAGTNQTIVAGYLRKIKS